jgi:hypothetical protein
VLHGTRIAAFGGVRDDTPSGSTGSAATVADKLAALSRMGVGHVMALQNFGLMPQHLVMVSMERLMREVMPRVRERIGAASAVA